MELKERVEALRQNTKALNKNTGSVDRSTEGLGRWEKKDEKYHKEHHNILKSMLFNQTEIVKLLKQK